MSGKQVGKQRRSCPCASWLVSPALHGGVGRERGCWLIISGSVGRARLLKGVVCASSASNQVIDWVELGLR